MKKISIVSINLNNRNGLRQTIESVVSQTLKDQINYIIIDGGSTDGSLDIIDLYKDQIDYWVSEKDKGIFNAMNKAIPHLVGDYALFLNSGDYLCDSNVIAKVITELDKDIVYGDEWKDRGDRKYISKYPDKVDEAYFKKTALPHQSTFIRTDLLRKHAYSEDWKLLGDTIWFYEEICENGVSYKHIKTPISVYKLDGISTRQRKEYEAEKKEYFNRKNAT